MKKKTTLAFDMYVCKMEAKEAYNRYSSSDSKFLKISNKLIKSGLIVAVFLE